MGSISKYRWLIEIAIRLLEAFVFSKGERVDRQDKRRDINLRS